MPSARTVVEIAATALDAIVVAGSAADQVIGGRPSLDEALAVLAGISRVAVAIRATLDDKAPPFDADHEIASLRGTIVRNNQAVDAQLDSLFPKK